MKININILNLKIAVEALKKLAEDYEINSKSIYLSIDNISNYWNIPISDIFFKTVEEYRNNNIEIYSLKNITNLLERIYNKFSNKYKQIYYISENSDKTIEILNDIIEDLKNIKEDYNNINIPLINNFSQTIYNQKNNIVKNIDGINAIKENIKVTANNLEEIETEIKSEIIKTQVLEMTEFTEINRIKNYKTEDKNRGAFIDTTGLENQLSNLITKLQYQEEIINKIIKNFHNFIQNYETDNNKKLEEIINIEINNFKIILGNFNKYILIIKEGIEKGIELESKLQEIFDKSNGIEIDIEKI